jgi:two-component system, OmpR family, sensor histidine kinase CpxA
LIGQRSSLGDDANTLGFYALQENRSMIRLLLKIFLAYWIAAGVVIFISDFEPHMHIHNPELMDALDLGLSMNARTIVDAYESGRCEDAQKRYTNSHNGLYLATPDGRLLCGDPGIADVQRVIAAAVRHQGRTIANYEWLQLIAVPVTSPHGAKYVVLVKDGYTSVLHFYGLLPGATTIAISCVVTLFLALLMALPIRRLRKAAGDIAMGRLDTRVRWGKPTARGSGIIGGDDIDQLVRDFNYMAERLQSLANAQQLLLRDVSHELRSPLTRLGVGLGLARTEAPAAMREHLDRIDSEAARLNYLIGQILSLSHLDLLHEIDSPNVISFSELVVDLLPDLQYEAAQGDCVIGTTISAGCYVCGDGELLRAAVENILRNAIKYARGSGLIHVETANEERSGESFCTVRVSDNGPGIPEHELRSVLEPFYRADRSRHWQQDGSGIGLAIADRAARLHRGIIGVRNKPDGGLVVEICLPSVQPSRDTSQAAYRA